METNTSTNEDHLHMYACICIFISYTIPYKHLNYIIKKGLFLYTCPYITIFMYLIESNINHLLEMELCKLDEKST